MTNHVQRSLDVSVQIQYLIKSVDICGRKKNIQNSKNYKLTTYWGNVLKNNLNPIFTIHHSVILTIKIRTRSVYGWMYEL